MPSCEVNDIRMYYEEHGEGEPLILMHGGLGAVGPDVRSGWFPLLPALSRRYRTLSVEHRGHGRTDNPAGRLSYALIADDMAQFIKRLNLAPVHIAGVSDGAIVGLALGMDRPDLVRSLISVGANYRVDDQLRDALGFFDSVSLERDHPDLAEALATRHDPHHRPGYWKELVALLQKTALSEPSWTEEDLRCIKAPTLLIAGEADFAVSLEQTLTMRREIPDAELFILNHAGLDGMANHLPQFTRPEVVGPVVLDFLRRHAGKAIP